MKDKLTVLDLFSGISRRLQLGPREDGRVQDHSLLRDRSVLPEGARKALAGSSGL